MVGHFIHGHDVDGIEHRQLKDLDVAVLDDFQRQGALCRGHIGRNQPRGASVEVAIREVNTGHIEHVGGDLDDVALRYQFIVDDHVVQ